MPLWSHKTLLTRCHSFTRLHDGGCDLVSCLLIVWTVWLNIINIVMNVAGSKSGSVLVKKKSSWVQWNFKRLNIHNPKHTASIFPSHKQDVLSFKPVITPFAELILGKRTSMICNVVLLFLIRILLIAAGVNKKKVKVQK